jgi:predicted ATP-grasp superfamily ATP-dependent carboligase
MTHSPHAGSAIVVAGVSVRAMAESASQGGWRVIGLDLFGDRDTRHACERWLRIGDPATLAIDAARLRWALAMAAEAPGVVGWVAGSGFEGAPDLLDAGGPRLRLFGMGAGPVATVRDARHFFATLDRLGLPHPQVSFEPPANPHGWLAKRAGGCGGWHIRAAGDKLVRHADTYWQRKQAGVPMSALFLADGLRASVVALNRLIVRRHGTHPHVYCGAIGPIADDALQARIRQVLAALVPAFALRGLASLDFIAEGDVPSLLEVNPRPSASMVLHAQAWPEGLIDAHVRAVQGRLPATPPMYGEGVRGSRIVFVDRDIRIDAAQARQLARPAHCHDLPTGAMHFGRGEPVCSVSAQAADARTLERMLEERCTAVLEPLIAHEETVSCACPP